MKKLIYLILFFIGICHIHPQSTLREPSIPNAGSAPPGYSALLITPDDIIIEENLDGGYHLWVRAKDSIGSIMITESTADPEKKNAVYAFRAQKPNDVNSSEKRILEGQELNPDGANLFLIDSTPQPHAKLGNAFHIFIPYVVDFGYPWTRHGDIYIIAGTFLNIRSFEKKYGDYTGLFLDNPFVLDVVQLPSPVPPPADYMADALENFTEIAELGGGEIIYSSSDAKLLDDIKNIIASFKGPTLDIVFAIDTTESMANDFIILKKGFAKTIDDAVKDYEEYRVGLVFYKDYNEEYLTKTFPFTQDTNVIKKLVESVRAWGGGDRPEAVYEALYESVTAFPWEAEDRVVILIGDAPAHPKARGRITKEMVYKESEAVNVTIYTMILPP